MRLLFSMLLVMLMVVSGHAETLVRIQGMAHKSEREVLDLLGGRLTQVRASPAAPSRADDAAFLLRKMLHNDGYGNAVVAWKIAGPNEIILIVNEGGRLKLGEVRITGVSEDEEKKLEKLFSTPAEKEMKFGGDPAPFREEDVATGLSYLEQEFHARGYWSAKATEEKRSIDKESGAVNLVIRLDAGKLYKIGTPTVSTPDGRGVELVTGVVKPFAGRTATTGNLNAMRHAAEELVASRGYPDADLRMSRRLQPGRFYPDFSIKLGERVRLGKVSVEGLERTDPKRVTRRVEPMEGEWYDEAAMNRKLRSFLATGAFSGVRLEKTATGANTIDATLHFVEANAKEVNVGLGAGSYEGGIVRFGYSDRNFLGRLLGFKAGFEYSGRGLLGEVSVSNPWLFGSETSGTARLFVLRYEREGYNSLEGGLAASVRRKFGDHYTVDVLAGVSTVNLDSDGLPEAVLGETSYQNPKIRLTQSLDYRDNPVLPTKGWHLICPLEFGAAVGSNSSTYAMLGLGGGWYHSFSPKYQIGAGGEFAALKPSGDGVDLPIDLRLFNGGSRSVRSFPERELGPRVNGYPTGGEVMWNTNFEVIRSFGGAAKAVWFLDAGAIDQSFEDMGSGSIELATGLGFRLDLPIGPVRFEYGYNLTKDPGEPTGTFHFAIGTAY